MALDSDDWMEAAVMALGVLLGTPLIANLAGTLGLTSLPALGSDVVLGVSLIEYGSGVIAAAATSLIENNWLNL